MPPEKDVQPLPNLGSKVNHHFRLNNSKLIEFEHPIYGLINSVVTTKDLKAGQELFAYYAYKKSPFPFDNPWYWEMKLIIEREERLALKTAINNERKLQTKRRKVKNEL